nr:MAG TPA: hypothetical protein [Caudoviricetes sp.]
MQLPLDFQKFFIKNIQKIKNGLRPSPPCFARSLPPRGSLGTRLTIFAEEMKIRPLIFRNLLLKIFRKIKNALRPSSVAVRRHLPPRWGRLYQRQRLTFGRKNKVY